jgi:methyl-accepting chemotaxis protein
MTVDERLQFLLQSTESLHSSVHEISASVQQLSSRLEDLTGSVANLKGVVENLRGVVEIDADNIRRLANIAAAHDGSIEDLATRLDRLEGRSKKNN